VDQMIRVTDSNLSVIEAASRNNNRASHNFLRPLGPELASLIPDKVQTEEGAGG
jgi:hypothetical protein